MMAERPFKEKSVSRQSPVTALMPSRQITSRELMASYF